MTLTPPFHSSDPFVVHASPTPPLSPRLARAAIDVQEAAGVRKIDARGSRAEASPAGRRLRRSLLAEGRAWLHRWGHVSKLATNAYLPQSTFVQLTAACRVVWRSLRGAQLKRSRVQTDGL